MHFVAEWPYPEARVDAKRVRLLAQSGKHLLGLRLTEFDPNRSRAGCIRRTFCNIDPGARLSLRPDVRGLHDRPPFFDLGLLNGAERLRSLLSERRDVLPQFGKPLAY
jgi:hypothetical protein